MSVDFYLEKRIFITQTWKEGFSSTAQKLKPESLQHKATLSEINTLRRELHILQALQRKGLPQDCDEDTLDNFVTKRLEMEQKRVLRNR